MSQQPLRHGDLVEVKRPSEILATLDERGTLAGLPFMPEMAPYCGRRFTVPAALAAPPTPPTLSGLRDDPDTADDDIFGHYQSKAKQ